MNDPAAPGFLERIPPPLYFLGCLFIGWGLGRAWPLPLGLTTLSLRLAVAVPLFVIAAAIVATALLAFRRARTSPKPFGIPARLLTSGPFRFSRNPLYVGLLLTLTALGASLNSGWLVALVPPLAFALGRFIVPGEEAVLLQGFGKEYQDYSRTVRRWL